MVAVYNTARIHFLTDVPLLQKIPGKLGKLLSSTKKISCAIYYYLCVYLYCRLVTQTFMIAASYIILWLVKRSDEDHHCIAMHNERGQPLSKYRPKY